MSRKYLDFRVIWPIIFSVLILRPAAWGEQARSRMIESMIRRNPLMLSDPDAAAAQADSLLRESQRSDSMRADTVSNSAADSTLETSLPPSVYEQLFRGELLDPDSLLDGLEVFGQEVFRRQRRERAGADAQGAVPAAYPVGPGDEVVVAMWGRLNEQHRLTVDRNGAVNVPHIGLVTVGGLSLSRAQHAIAKRLEAIEGVQVSVTLGALRTMQVYTMGEVASPGMHTVSALSNVTSVLFAAGGPTPMGSLRGIEVRRYGKRIKRLDFYDFLLRGADPSRIRLLPGDVIFVPIVKHMVAVAGNVRRSAIYEILPESTLPEVLELAGGVSPGGWVNRIQIERMVNNRYQTVLDVDAPASDSIPEFEIIDGDIIKVFPVVNLNEMVVSLEGNVKRPGKYALRENMRISDVITGYDALLPETYFIYAVVERFDPPSYLARIIPFNLRDVLQYPGSDADLPLQSRDRILVYHRDYFEPDRSVVIEGAVTTPGKFKLLENMRIRDLVLQAGGLREDASMYRGELYRRRLEVDSVSTEKFDFSVIGAMNDDPEQNLLLQRFDRVFVRQKRGWREQKTISLVGEFVYPGDYVALEGETLQELVERAGGFTADAYLLAAIMTRPSVRELERKRLQEYVGQLERDIAQTAAVAAAEGAGSDAQAILNQQMQLLEKLRRTQPTGRIVVDLTENNNIASLLLEDGDVLYVPKNLQTVSVIGEVYNPATFRHRGDGDRVRRYIDLSGGVKPSARKRDVYVVRANGSVVSRRMARVMRYRLSPGDVVVVPQKVTYNARYRRFANTLDAILKVTTIATQTSGALLQFKVATESSE